MAERRGGQYPLYTFQKFGPNCFYKPPVFLSQLGHSFIHSFVYHYAIQ